MLHVQDVHTLFQEPESKFSRNNSFWVIFVALLFHFKSLDVEVGSDTQSELFFWDSAAGPSMHVLAPHAGDVLKLCSV